MLIPSVLSIGRVEQAPNLRRALRSAGPKAAERISFEIESVANELREAEPQVDELRLDEPPRITPKLVSQAIDEMNGIRARAPLETRVAWVRDLFERVDVDTKGSPSGTPRRSAVLTARTE